MVRIMKCCSIFLLFWSVGGYAQPNIMPAKPQDSTIVIQGADIHIGNGQVIENGILIFSDGIIEYVDSKNDHEDLSHAIIIDARGKHIYPGFIAPNTTVGLVEISSVRATIDFAEVGENNAHVRSLIAYNTDSKVINTLRSNGILLAQITPQRGLLSGQSSIVQLDAWNWEDAAYMTDDGLHVNWPEWRFSSTANSNDMDKRRREVNQQVLAFQDYIRQARAYLDLNGPKVANARYEAFQGIFSGTKRLFIHVNQATGIISAINKMKEIGLSPVIVGGREAHLVLPILKENDISVILSSPHRLPSQVDQDVNAPYKQAKVLHDAGVLSAYSVQGFWEQRNLPFIAGTAAAFGLDKEVALQYITLNTAKILGISDRTGSIEVGKDANLFISTGDALDMRTNNIERAFIQGREINLSNLHKQLFERYQRRYDMAEGDNP